MVRYYASTSIVVSLTEADTIRALGVTAAHGLPFRDALIWSSAKHAQASVLYSEDFQHDRVLDGVRFVNPFLTTTP